MSEMCIGKKLWYVSATALTPIKVEVTGYDSTGCEIVTLNSNDEELWVYCNEIKMKLFESYEEAKEGLIQLKVIRLWPNYINLADKIAVCESYKKTFVEKIKELNLWEDKKMLEKVLKETASRVGVDLKYVVEETKKEEE